MSPAANRRNDNPYLSILGNALEQQGVSVMRPSMPFGGSKAQAVHLHWLEQVFWGRLSSRSNTAAALNAERLIRWASDARSRDGRVVWTVHNLAPHEGMGQERAAIWSRLTDALLPLVTDVVTMSESAQIPVFAAYPAAGKAKPHVIRHPHYRDHFNRLGIAETKAAERPIILCIGKMRRYKQVPELVRVFQERTHRDYRLVIAGLADADYAAEIADAIGSDHDILFRNEEISDAELLHLLRTASATIFNFSTILNSGSVLAALSAGSRVMCSAHGALTELAADVGSDWVRTYEGPLTATWLDAQLDDLKHANPVASAPDLSAYDPSLIAAQHRAVYLNGSGVA
jgi:beta-1,4-mannosyltransferase